MSGKASQQAGERKKNLIATAARARTQARKRTWATALVLTSACGVAVQARSTSIYSCVDEQGRTLKSDRLIPECADREQRELNPSGTVRRTVGPMLTAQEHARQEAREKQLADERSRQMEDKRRDRALLTRYLTKAMHDKERAEVLEKIDAVIQSANDHIEELARQRKTTSAQLEFYKSTPDKMPPLLVRQVEEIEQGMEVQKRFIAEQEGEKRRVNARFDEELLRLTQLWDLPQQTAAADASAAPAPGR